MKGAVKRYQVTIKELNDLEGSAGYDEEMKTAETTYRTETEGNTSALFRTVIKAKEDYSQKLRTHRDPSQRRSRLAGLTRRSCSMLTKA